MKYWRVLLVGSLSLIYGPVSGLVFAQNYASNPNPGLQLDSTAPGASPAHHLSFTAQLGELETYRVKLRYPQTFEFKGFTVPGPLNTPVGSYALDLNNDNQADISFALRSLDDDKAYIDITGDAEFSPGLEPTLSYFQDGFSLILPFGGDANPDTLLIPWSARVTLTLFAGIMRNPEAIGNHTISATLWSVDPDNDDLDDNNGTAPQSFSSQLSVTIAQSDQIFVGGFDDQTGR